MLSFAVFLVGLFGFSSGTTILSGHSGPLRLPNSRVLKKNNNFNKGLKLSGNEGLYALVDSTDLGQYDLNTGVLTVLAKADIPFLSETGENIGCLDNINGIYYMIYEDPLNKSYTGLYPYNLIDPKTKYKKILLTMLYPQDAVGADDGCIANPTTGAIYIWGKDMKNKETLLIEVNYDKLNNNFNIKTIGNYSEINREAGAEPGSNAVFDNKRNKIWISGYGSGRSWDYFYIDVSSGALINTISIDYYAYDSMYYDINLDYVLAVSIDRQNSGYFNIYFKYLDPQSLKEIKTFDANNNQYCGLSTIFNEDVKTGIYYQITYKLMTTTNCTNFHDLEGYISLIDVKTGKITKDVPVCPGLMNCPWDIEYYDP